MKKISKEVTKVFAENAGISIIIGILAGLIITAISLLNFLSSFLCLVAFCLLGIPLLFACHLAYAAIAMGIELNMSTMLNYLKQYYSYSYFGVFRIVKALLKAMLALLICIFLFGMISTAILYRLDSAGFNEAINAFYEYSYLGEEAYSFSEIMTMNNGILSKFLLIAIVPSFALSTMYFSYKLGLKSMNIYFRIGVPKMNLYLVRSIEDQVYAKNKWSIKKDLFSYNWFVIPLMIVFAVGGAVLGFFNFEDPSQVAFLSVSFIALSSVIYFPIYFYRMHGLYSKYELEYKKNTLDVTKKLYEKIVAQSEFNELQKEEFKQTLDELENEENENSEES